MRILVKATIRVAQESASFTLTYIRSSRLLLSRSLRKRAEINFSFDLIKEKFSFCVSGFVLDVPEADPAPDP